MVWNLAVESSRGNVYLSFDTSLKLPGKIKKTIVKKAEETIYQLIGSTDNIDLEMHIVAWQKVVLHWKTILFK